MKNLRSMANNKVVRNLKTTAEKDNGLGDVVVKKREPDNYISNEAREFIQNSI